MAAAVAPVHAADPRSVRLSPANPVPDTPSGAELVGRLLAERATGSDPDVPLPQRDLVAPAPAFVPLVGPRLYGRRDEGSVVVGLRIPIPADRGALQQGYRR